MSEPRFGEVLTAMVTPFADDRSLDLDGVRTLAAYLIDHGSDGLVVAGTTGESPTLTHDEKLDLFQAVVDEVGDRATVIVGTGSNDTKGSVELTKEVSGIDVDGILVVTPYYNKPPQNGLLEHFRAVADAASAPVMLYDVPPRTARRIERATVVELAAHENIVAVKDAVGDATETANLRRELDDAGHDDFQIYSGDDPMLLPHLAAGAVGIVSVCSHLVGTQIKQIFSAWKDGKTDDARATYLGLLPLMTTIMGLTSSPIPVKAAVNMLGVAVGEPRLPLVPPTREESAAIRRALEAAGLL